MKSVNILSLILAIGAALMAESLMAESTTNEITVLSWNTEHYNFNRWPGDIQKELERNMFELIKTAQPDIFLIQETYGSFERFKAAFPTYHAVLQSECNSVFSKFPIGASKRLWVDRLAKKPLVFNTPVLEFADVQAGNLHLRVSSFAMFWLPTCCFVPQKLSADELLKWEASPQKYPLTPRPKAIAEVVAAMQNPLDEKDAIPMIIGGDFNSMSHLDWTAANANAERHCGRVVPWPVSKAMVAAGFVDSYRAVHPDETKHPGLSCPVAGCLDEMTHPVTRIDYIYSAGKKLVPVASETIQGRYHRPFEWRGKKFSLFPSDHAAILTRFAVR